jgi:hypothetical protein
MQFGAFIAKFAASTCNDNETALGSAMRRRAPSSRNCLHL